MAVGFSNTNKPLNPRGNDQSPKGYNRAELYTGKALDFDGTNDNVEVADNSSLDFTTAMSAFCYMRVDTLSTGGGVDYAISKYDYGNNNRSWLLGQRDNELIAVVSKNGFSGPANTKDRFSVTFKNTSDYYFVGFTFESNVLKLYVNGQEVSTSKANDAEVNSIYSGNADVCVGSGQFNGSGIGFLNGKVANARAFNIALTAAQVADLYNNPEKIVPTGVSNDALKLWLPMQEGAGTTAYDGSGNGNHGTISGATYTHGIGAPVSQTAVIDWNKGTNNIENHDWDFGQSTNNASVSTSSHSAPNGVETAYIFQDDSFNTFHRVYKTAGCSAGEITASVFVKKKDVDYINVGLGVNGGSKSYALVDLVNGTINDTEASPTATSIQSVGNGWYYVSVQKTHTSGSGIVYIYGQNPTNGSSFDDSYTGANNQTYIWGASVKDGPINNVFVPTIGTAQTSDVLLPAGLTTGRDITGVNLFENVRKQGALNLDGNSWAEVHDNASLDITDAITLEAWVYWDDASAKGILGRWHIDASSRNYLLYKLSATNISFYINSNNLINQGGLTATKGWTHIVGTYNRTNAVLYIDGVQQATAAHTNAISTGTLPVEIGRNFTTANQALTAPIAQPRIYNRALTASEVLRNYNSGKNTYK